MKSPWTDPEYRAHRRESSVEERCVYLQGKADALSQASLTLARIVAQLAANASGEDDKEKVRETHTKLIVNTLVPRATGKPSEEHLKAQYSDGWENVRGMLEQDIRG